MFYDNIEDYEFLLSETGRETIIDLHIDGIVKYIKELESK